MEELERHRPVVAEVAGEVDRGHAPASELALERVSLHQRLTQPLERIDRPYLRGERAKDTADGNPMRGR
jgi:hypothetical protein